MKLPTHKYLDKLNIPYERLAFPATTKKGAANVARVLGYRERQMIKTLVLKPNKYLQKCRFLGIFRPNMRV